MAERLLRKQKVAGSTPVLGSGGAISACSPDVACAVNFIVVMTAHA